MLPDKILPYEPNLPHGVMYKLSGSTDRKAGCDYGIPDSFWAGLNNIRLIRCLYSEAPLSVAWINLSFYLSPMRLSVFFGNSADHRSYQIRHSLNFHANGYCYIE